MSESQEGQIEIICKEYNPALYNDTMGSVEPVCNVVTLENVFAPPLDVPSFVATQNMGLIQFKWQKVLGDEATYEIREGTSWDTSSLVATDLSGDSFAISDIKDGTYNYWIKAKTKKAIYSGNATLSVLSVKKPGDITTIVNEDLLAYDLRSGTFTYCFAARSKDSYRIIPDSNINWYDAGTWDNLGQYYEIDGKWGTDVVKTATYESPVYNIGSNTEALVTLDSNLSRSDEITSLTAEWKYSEDNVNWSDYQTFNLGVYKFRYYKFKITINSPSSKICSVDKFVVSVSVAKKEYIDTVSIDNAESGVTVNFGDTFTYIPMISAIISDGTVGYCVVTYKDKSQATIKAYNNSGSQLQAITATKIDVKAKGY